MHAPARYGPAASSLDARPRLDATAFDAAWLEAASVNLLNEPPTTDAQADAPSTHEGAPAASGGASGCGSTARDDGGAAYVGAGGEGVLSGASGTLGDCDALFSAAGSYTSDQLGAGFGLEGLSQLGASLLPNLTGPPLTVAQAQAQAASAAALAEEAQLRSEAACVRAGLAADGSELTRLSSAATRLAPPPAQDGLPQYGANEAVAAGAVVSVGTTGMSGGRAPSLAEEAWPWPDGVPTMGSHVVPTGSDEELRAAIDGLTASARSSLAAADSLSTASLAAAAPAAFAPADDPTVDSGRAAHAPAAACGTHETALHAASAAADFSAQLAADAAELHAAIASSQAELAAAFPAPALGTLVCSEHVDAFGVETSHETRE